MSSTPRAAALTGCMSVRCEEELVASEFCCLVFLPTFSPTVETLVLGTMCAGQHESDIAGLTWREQSQFQGTRKGTSVRMSPQSLINNRVRAPS